jgi:hypothetical protein
LKRIGRRYATFAATVDGQPSVVKAMDPRPGEGVAVRCYREALGARLGTRLGLAVPRTSLVEHPEWGRISVQRWVGGARPLSAGRWAELARSPPGLRILLLDLLVANRDRHRENLLERDGAVFPIDFNVAFGFADDPPRVEPAGDTILRWLGVGGAAALAPRDLGGMLAEAHRAERALSPEYLHCAVADLPERFLRCGERERLLAGLLERRTLLEPWVRRFWCETIEPLHRMTEAHA